MELRGVLPGGHCKSLFLRDRREGFWLVVALEDRRIDLKELSIRLAAPRFSFANPEQLYATLGVHPGSVTPFALINDPAHRVSVVLDAEMLEHELLNYHPLINTATTTLSSKDLLSFIADCGHRPRIMPLGDPARAGNPSAG